MVKKTMNYKNEILLNKYNKSSMFFRKNAFSNTFLRYLIPIDKIKKSDII